MLSPPPATRAPWPLPPGTPSTQVVAMYLTGADAASAACSYSTCQFQYAQQWTPTSQYYVSLGGSGGSPARPYRAYGTIYGTTADFTAASSYAITQGGGYGCATDPALQYYGGGGSTVVDGGGTGIVKWCARGSSPGAPVPPPTHPRAAASRPSFPPVASTSRFASTTLPMGTAKPRRPGTRGRQGLALVNPSREIGHRGSSLPD